MDCKEFSILLDAYLDGTLPDETADRVRAHGESCADCTRLLTVRMDCRLLDEEIEVPASFSAGWRRMLREESEMEQAEHKRRGWKNWIAAAAALVFVVGGTLLTRDQLTPASARPSGAVYQEAASDAAASPELMARGAAANYSMMAESAFGGAETGSAQEEKIIRTAGFTLKSAAYDEDLKKLEELTGQLDGRVEYLSRSGDQASGELRSASLTLRVPAARLDEFLEGAQAIGRVTSLRQEIEDVSDSYRDVQARLDTQRQKMERLQTLMASADNVSDLIEIESAVADTQYLLDSYTAQLQNYDSRVDYSTVNVSLREIRAQESAEIGLGRRILSGLESSLAAGMEFLEDSAVFLVAVAPWMLLTGAVAALTLLLVRKGRKHRKE